MIRKIGILVFFIAFLVSCDSNYSFNGNKKKRPLTEEELKAQLLLKECGNSTKYIHGELNYTPIYKGLLSMKVKGLKLNFKIFNNSTLATYKDIKCHVVFLSKTGSSILEKDFIIYEYIKPNNRIEYKTEMRIDNQQFKDIEKFEWKVIDASCM